MGIRGCTEVMPNVPQALVFDTAFHQTMPDYAYMYPIPYETYEKYHIRRYGAHGTSHRFVSIEMAKLLDKPVEETKIVTCHIGNGLHHGRQGRKMHRYFDGLYAARRR